MCCLVCRLRAVVVATEGGRRERRAPAPTAGAGTVGGVMRRVAVFRSSRRVQTRWRSARLLLWWGWRRCSLCRSTCGRRGCSLQHRWPSCSHRVPQQRRTQLPLFYHSKSATVTCDLAGEKRDICCSRARPALVEPRLQEHPGKLFEMQ
jgi:hypothetical protein